MTSPAAILIRNGTPKSLQAVSATTLIDQLLAEQRELTAVEMFSRAHDSHKVGGQLYRDLLPASPPAVGQQYAFEVDLDRCYGCKACVSACHSLNGLDEDESWRSVGLLMGHHANARAEGKGSKEAPGKPPPPQFSSASRPSFQQHVTTACHHCVDPGCLNGCPVLAYDKDPLTGIVRHLDDQCIGCQYCVMKCPYEVPQYSKARGIVRKCDMCSSRLAVGEAPACVQACPGRAIRITLVEPDKVRGKYRGLPALNGAGRGEKGQGRAEEIPTAPFRLFASANAFLAASPNPAVTLPSTRFVTARTLPENLFAGDHAVIRPAEPHLPLVILLVLSQLAVGASGAALLVPPTLPLLVVALIAGVMAMAAGSLHLGQPLKAWRSFLGWRKSWFSREVIAMSGFVFLLALAVGAVWLPGTRSLGGFIAPLAALMGLITVACSAMIYADTRRDFWNAAQSFTKFFGTTLVLGAAVTLATLTCIATRQGALVAPALVLALGTLAKLAFERRIGAHLVAEEAPMPTLLNKTARLLEDELSGFVRARISCGVLGGLALPFIAVTHPTVNVSVVAVAALALSVAGELLERYLFFTAVATQKMPGGIGT